MLIKCLAEDTPGKRGLKAEHGLSLYIETEGRRFLFDTGQSEALLENARLLEVPLSEIDAVFISHGHYDHGGGLRAFLKANRKAKIYMSKYAFGEFYNGDRYIGLDRSLSFGERLVSVDVRALSGDGFELLPCIFAKEGFERPPSGLCMKKNGSLVPDDFRHEICLLLSEGGKRFLFSGCSHNGVLNIAEAFRPDILIGGFHFSGLSVSREEDAEILRRAGESLKKSGIELFTCHCTGYEQYKFLKELIGEKIHYLHVGDVLEL